MEVFLTKLQMSAVLFDDITITFYFLQLWFYIQNASTIGWYHDYLFSEAHLNPPLNVNEEDNRHVGKRPDGLQRLDWAARTVAPIHSELWDFSHRNRLWILDFAEFKEPNHTQNRSDWQSWTSPSTLQWLVACMWLCLVLSVGSWHMNWKDRHKIYRLRTAVIQKTAF